MTRQLLSAAPDDAEATQRTPVMRSRFPALRHAPFAGILVVGVALRVMATMAYQPALRFPDSSLYLTGEQTLRPNPLRPLGYSIFLWTLEPSGSLAWIPIAQHAIGLALAVALYAFLVGQNLRRWLATVAAAPLTLDAYEIQIEQYVLAETLFLALLLLSLGLLLRRPRPGYLSVTGCGLLLAAAALTRSTALPLIAVPAGYLLLRRVGWRRLALLVFAFTVPMAAYAGLYHHAHGTYALGGNTGRFLYGRVAPFADCHRLTGLPPSQRRLCQMTPPAQRTTGSEWYDWNRSSPAARVRGTGSDALLRSFAERAIIAQPGSYAAEIAHDTVHYFLPGRPATPQDSCQDFWQFQATNPQTMQLCASGSLKVGWLGVMTFGYDHQPVAHRTDTRLVALLRDYQTYAYTPGPLLALCLLLSIVASARPPRQHPRRRHLAAAAATAGATAALLVLTPSATAVFDYRYGLQLIVLLPAAGALAFAALTPRLGLRQRSSSPAGGYRRTGDLKRLPGRSDEGRRTPGEIGLRPSAACGWDTPRDG